MAEAQDRWHFPHPRLHRGGQLPPCRPTAPRSSRSATLHCLLVLAPAHSSGGEACLPLLAPPGGVFAMGEGGSKSRPPCFSGTQLGASPRPTLSLCGGLTLGRLGGFWVSCVGAFALKMGGRWGQGQGMRVEGVLSRLCVGEVG